MQTFSGRTLIAGVTATLVITVAMYGLAPWFTGHPMNVAQLLAGLLGISILGAVLVHVALGAIVFPFAYARTLARVKMWPPSVRGLLFGGILWVLAEAIVVPLAGGGFFHAASGGFAAVLASAVAHALYGATLGGIAGPRRGTSVEVPAETPLRHLEEARRDAETAGAMQRPRRRPSEDPMHRT